jgi:hypothetical protein
MADIYSVAQTVSNAGATVATLGSNSRKVTATTQFGTRALKFITITADNASDSDIDFTASYASGTGTFAGAYTDSNSYFSKAVRAIQLTQEVYAVGTPTATAFTVVVADDTGNGAETSSNVQAATYGQMEADIKASLGIGAKASLATNYNGAITAAVVVLSGAALA